MNTLNLKFLSLYKRDRIQETLSEYKNQVIASLLIVGLVTSRFIHCRSSRCRSVQCRSNQREPYKTIL
jgi:hypothetical protein